MQETDIAKFAFENVKSFTDQLITLSTGVLALTITFTKDIVKKTPTTKSWILFTGWFIFLISIISGICVYSTLTGTLAPLDGTPSLTIGENTRLFSGIQFVAFILAILCTIIYGFISVRNQISANTEIVAEIPATTAATAQPQEPEASTK